MCARLVTNQGLQDEVNKLEAQIKALQPGSPEYEYDQLQLDREERELDIRKENPSLDPMTLDGEEALQQIMAQDPILQAIKNQTTTLIDAYPQKSSSWGIPMADTQYTKVCQVN